MHGTHLVPIFQTTIPAVDLSAIRKKIQVWNRRFLKAFLLYGLKTYSAIES